MTSTRAPSATDRPVVVFGAYGHTGRFVVSELRRRGHQLVLAGRDRARLESVGRPGEGLRVASVEDAASLDQALEGAALVVNCAGPFIATAGPLIDAALRAGAHYLDVAAEQRVALAAFEDRAGQARDAGVVIVPAMAYFGGLGDLLATVAMGDWTEADGIRIGHALDSWLPTLGSRETGRVNSGHHVLFIGDRYVKPPELADQRRWVFPAPYGTVGVTELGTADQVTIHQHLSVPEIRVFMHDAALRDIEDPTTPAPTPADESGRSAQTFLVEVVVRRGDQERRASAQGRDIYAVTAPLVAEAVQRVLDGRCKALGVVAAGEAFDAEDFLTALSPQHLTWQKR